MGRRRAALELLLPTMPKLLIRQRQLASQVAHVLLDLIQLLPELFNSAAIVFQLGGGGCLVVRDKLYFYISGRAINDKFWDGDCSTGLAPGLRVVFQN